MSYFPENALIVQSDRSVLLEVHSPRADEAREAIAPFTELIKSPEHIHTYRLSPLSIWNARAAGLMIEQMLKALQDHTKYPMPEAVVQEIATLGQRYGLTTIERDGEYLQLTTADLPLAELLIRNQEVSPLLGERISQTMFRVNPVYRGVLKQALLSVGYPAEDLAGYVSGDAIALELRETTLSGSSFRLRDYQKEAVAAFILPGGSVTGW
jgi:DNA excision repair protein ERCC-3